MARKNYRQMSIEKLVQFGYGYEEAVKLQRRLYRQVLYQTRTRTTKTGKIRQERPFKTSRELFYSLTSNKGSIKFTQDFSSVDRTEIERARDILKTKMKNLIKKTGGMKGEVGKAINSYLRGKITYKEFKASVNSVKRKARYMAVQEETIS